MTRWDRSGDRRWRMKLNGNGLEMIELMIDIE